MSNNLFITATEARSGKSAISLGIMELLVRNVGRVGFFRPLIDSDHDGAKKDNDILLFSSYFKLTTTYEKMYSYTVSEAKTLIGSGRQDELIEGIFNSYRAIERDHDFVLCEGIDIGGTSPAFEFDINAEISRNLGCPVLLVVNGYQKDKDEIVRSANVYNKSIIEKGCDVIAMVVNRIRIEDRDGIIAGLRKEDVGREQLIYAVPNEKTLGNPTVGEIARLLDAEVLYGGDQLNRHVYSFTVAAMQLSNFLKRIEDRTLIIVPGDRSDVIVACLSSVSSMTMPKIAGIMLTGGLKPDESVCKLIDGFSAMVPILSVKSDTFPSAIMVNKVHAGISPDNERKITRALEVFDKNIDAKQLAAKIIQTRTKIVTPKMFEYGLLQKAKAHRQHIVLPEGEDERVLQAAEILLRRDVVDLTLIGNAQKIREKILQLRLLIDSVKIVEIGKSDIFQDYVKTYFELRKGKGITEEIAGDIMSDVSFFGTMMVYKGDADGMVSGAIHTTQATIRPAFEIIRTKPGCSVVSSVFMMCLKDRVLVYGDCAVNPDPDAKKLAEIAISSAQTAMTFGIEPRVAMLSYSTGESGKGEEVEKVREATRIARQLAVDAGIDLKLEGPIQYDAAIDPEVAKIKMPESEVAGRATVFIFPDLNTGNNTYKAVQRSAGAVAIGPVLQGLNKPVNDLSRGCTVADIVNTVAITAIQAQAEKGLV
ncbi:Phosphate acetyltransferase [uncultured Desulfobacterium sp.]|uniref:Phosphate acetyltransferase n=1 Tax=uncultured Desulfobacterium sp. TaxID=201089 RepID=A0A445MRT3_9BACT|nr:Phosphate acetyltransferase [uncultured Desulfobacterium sp.]